MAISHGYNLLRITTVFVYVLLSACGGGGGGSSSSGSGGGGGGGGTVAASGTISGSVSGTTILAVNDQGNIVASADTAGRTPDVDTDGNGTLDSFSFTLNDVPLGNDIRVYLVTGGSIYPMYFDTDGDGTSDSNVFALATGSSTSLALGFVDVSVVGEGGRAIPQNNPANTSGITTGAAIEEIPPGVNQPPTENLSVAELNTKGDAALASGWVLGARTYYEAAVQLAANSNSNDADTARFMLALTRVSALGYDTLSDGNSGDMNRLGDFLDLYGVVDDGTRANMDLIDIPEILPNDSPTGNDLRDFLYGTVRTELMAAVANLGAVSSAFNAQVTDFTSDDTFEVDYGDALFFSAFFRSVQAKVEIQAAYSMDVDVDKKYNDAGTTQGFLADNPNFLGISDTQKLTEAKASVNGSLDDLDAAIVSITGEADNQIDDFITIDPVEIGASVAEMQAWIAETRASVAGTSQNIGNVALDLEAFFSGVDIRSTLPPFSGDDAGFFPDTSMGGVIADTGLIDVNEDLDLDNIPDIME